MNSLMLRLAESSRGRCLLHLFCMVFGKREHHQFHRDGIKRDSRPIKKQK